LGTIPAEQKGLTMEKPEWLKKQEAEEGLDMPTDEPKPSMFEQLDAFKLYDAFLSLMSGIDMYSTDNLKRVHEEIVLRSKYEDEDEHLVRMARGIMNALDAEIALRSSVPNKRMRMEDLK
jgi:hypothetical protein